MRFPVILTLILLPLAAGPGLAGDSSPAWNQWGGPHRDFSVDASGLAEEWPEDGPPRLWKQALGDDGYSMILYDAGVLYTMAREGDTDAVVALDAATGKTVWKTNYDSPTKQGQMLDFGPGPLSTPLLTDGHLYTVSATHQVHCFDQKTGKLVWGHDLIEEMGARLVPRGYGSSPIAYGDNILMVVGGKGQGIVAFDKKTGEVAWKKHDLGGGYSSPILGQANGKDAIFFALGMQGSAVDPTTGDLLWKADLSSHKGFIMATPHWGEDGLIFCSSAYGGGSGAIQVSVENGEVKTEELWFSRKLRIQHASMVRKGDYVYGSSGDFGPCFLMAVNVKDGDVAWRKRGFAKATVLGVGDRMLILDEDGVLALATATPEDLVVHSKTEVLENQAWTVPTLAGTHLFLRDRKNIVALDLGAQATSKGD